MQVEIVAGEVSNVLARVYVRIRVAGDDAAELARLTGDSDCRVSGSITGPLCAHAHTLPATIPLRDRGPGPTPLAEATLPDPCFWSPESPNLYEANVVLHGKDAKRPLPTQTFGLRRLTTRGESLYLDGKRFVVRGISVRIDTSQRPAGDFPAADSFELAALREHGLALLVPHPSDELCEAASREGVLIAADLRTLDTDQNVAAARRLAAWPAVGIVVLGACDLPRGDLPRSLLAAQRIDGDGPVQVGNWADLLITRVKRSSSGAAELPDNLPPGVPILAVDDQKLGTGKPEDDVASHDARTACDGLQRALAPQWDLAGYIVGAGGLPSAQS